MTKWCNFQAVLTWHNNSMGCLQNVAQRSIHKELVCGPKMGVGGLRGVMSKRSMILGVPHFPKIDPGYGPVFEKSLVTPA